MMFNFVFRLDAHTHTHTHIHTYTQSDGYFQTSNHDIRMKSYQTRMFAAVHPPGTPLKKVTFLL